MFAKEIKRKRKRRSPGRAPLRASLTTRIFCSAGQLSLGNSSSQAPEEEAVHVLVAPEFASLTAPRRRTAAGSPCKGRKNRPLSLQNISAALSAPASQSEEQHLAFQPHRRISDAPPFASPSRAPGHHPCLKHGGAGSAFIASLSNSVAES